MQVQLTQKETLLLNDMENYEKLCVQKSGRYAQEAQDPTLRQILQDLNQREQQHLQTIQQLISGQVPNMNQGGQGQSNLINQLQQTIQANQGQQSQQGNPSDSFMCNDFLSYEKHASHVYDTAIFEFQDTNLREALNHIQKEEQEHGDILFKYMQANGMYKVQ
ncbi:coat F domain-containing protein [Desulfitobacterium dichloroeliminans LMG P-21439]|uniref:Coat F domain-containing protein n=1 Tax=Desulfitobacterium dichloroeliminans (strain LMG P-21439 / DCA1) TaxID=871963 RepID=L0F597_DESDL|nr:spore coat protein [Desulfitobacterium dichloroeliminans]AGA67841.1 coat F domain-containing protein [Desulfitobacterium dichloroeliminans LMG P-21439]